MSKKKWFVSTILFTCLITLFTFYWAYNHKIIDGNFTRLTISKMGTETKVIENKNEINKIITLINKSPRKFYPNTGLRYDYMPHGMLIFENDQEKVAIGFVIPKGNALTKYWEIETNFEFGKDVE